MRDGYALAEAGRAEFLPRKQAVEYHAAADVVVVFEQQAGAFEHTLFAADVKIKQDIGERQ